MPAAFEVPDRPGRSAEIVLPPGQVVEAGALSFACGQVGQRAPLTTPEARQEHAAQLAAYTGAITRFNTADCGDDRPVIWLADGTVDPAVLEARVVAQLFGGLGLASTKAAVAADAALVREARTMQEAYEIVSGYLAELGEEDGGHLGCGASLSVESSVAHPIRKELLVPSVGLLVPMNPRVASMIDENMRVKTARLEAGFYGGWDPEWHTDYLSNRFPQNFSQVAVDHEDHETQGHNGSSLYVVTQPGHGFARNAFCRRTGQQAFGLSLPKMQEVALLLGETAEEQARILVGFVDDSLHVGGGIVTAGLPVFVETA